MFKRLTKKYTMKSLDNSTFKSIIKRATLQEVCQPMWFRSFDSWKFLITQSLQSLEKTKYAFSSFCDFKPWNPFTFYSPTM